VVIAAIVAARVAHGAGLPSLLVFLGLGLALGEAGLGVRFDNAGLAQSFGLSALVLILAEGGLTTSWEHTRAAAPAALALATVGVAVSGLAVAVAAWWLLSFTWQDAVLLGAVLAPTDAAAVFSVLRKLPLPPRLSGMLEGESGLNDAPTVLAVTAQIGLFVMLGLLASPARLPGAVLPALVAGAALVLIARPAAVLVSTLPLRVPGASRPSCPGRACAVPCRSCSRQSQ
jgi:cell volume regulation protein A